MMRTRRPGGVDERVMDVLLNVIDDVAGIPRKIVGIESTPGGGLEDRAIMSRTDGRLDVRAKQ